MDYEIHPRDYPIVADSKARCGEYLEKQGHKVAGMVDAYLDAEHEVRWCWEEIAQLNAGIKFLENLLDTKSTELEQWKNEARSATHSLRALRALVPPL